MKPESSLRNNIKLIRIRLGLSQQDLAKEAGISRQMLGGVESGKYAPSVTIALSLATVLGCTVEDLFSLSEDSLNIEAIPTPSRSSRAAPESDFGAGGRKINCLSAARVGGISHRDDASRR